LNHFTLPVAISKHFFRVPAAPCNRAAGCSAGILSTHGLESDKEFRFPCRAPVQRPLGRVRIV